MCGACGLFARCCCCMIDSTIMIFLIIILRIRSQSDRLGNDAIRSCIRFTAVVAKVLGSTASKVGVVRLISSPSTAASSAAAIVSLRRSLFGCLIVRRAHYCIGCVVASLWCVASLSTWLNSIFFVRKVRGGSSRVKICRPITY